MHLIRYFILLVALNGFATLSFAGDSITWIDPNIGIIKLSERLYLIKSYQDAKTNRSVDANHLLIVDKQDIVLINTPWTNDNTAILLDWVKKTFSRPVSKVIITHFHIDCAGGLEAVSKQGIITYCLDITKKLLPADAQISVVYHDSLSIQLQSLNLMVMFPGAGHTKDNAIAWILAEKVLYGGCLVKSLSATSMGNIADADLKAWPTSIQVLQRRFSNAKLIIPGHLEQGDTSLLNHTLKLLGNK